MADIHFGTDGWRAIIGEDFTNNNIVRVIDAAAKEYKLLAEQAGFSFEQTSTQASAQAGLSSTQEGCSSARPATQEGCSSARPATLYIGHDCRQDAHSYSMLAAQVAASHGFRVKLTQDYCPTPTLCWSVGHDPDAIGGIMMTSSHNPANYLGIKLRMQDGGASPKEFTDRVEAQLIDRPTDGRGRFETVDLMTDYLAALRDLVDVEAIRAAKLRVVLDPMFGAARGYLAELLREAGVEVCEINNAEDPTFDGLHPEPIPPWVDRGLARVAELGYDALFTNDGDADRISAGDSQGNFVNPHRIITLVVQHMVEDRHETGRVVSTVTASAILERLCRELGLEYVSTPVGFKWIYGEMQKGGVLVGGEESGGIGLPGHVMERDGLLMALLLTEMMAQRKKTLGELVDDLCAKVGRMEFMRRGLTVTDEQMHRFRTVILTEFAPTEFAGQHVVGFDRRDGVKILLPNDAWVMMRPSGTEPLIRIYAEAASQAEVDAFLDEATRIITE